MNPSNLNVTDEVRPIEILLVEDNLGDVRITQEVIKESKLMNKLHVINDGVQAMEFLRKEGRFSGVNTPDIILLDLNLPYKNGKEVLAEIKSDPLLSQIPVAILTHSEEEADIVRAQELQANCYMLKPVDIEQFLVVVKSLDDFYLSIVKQKHT